jgi:hypothetical protein
VKNRNRTSFVGTVERIWKPQLGYNFSDVAECKRFLNQFASDHNFDPLIPQNWYPISRKQILDKVKYQGESRGESETIVMFDLRGAVD